MLVACISIIKPLILSKIVPLIIRFIGRNPMATQLTHYINGKRVAGTSGRSAPFSIRRRVPKARRLIWRPRPKSAQLLSPHPQSLPNGRQLRRCAVRAFSTSSLASSKIVPKNSPLPSPPNTARFCPMRWAKSPAGSRLSSLQPVRRSC